jgi:molybdopterin adenylyltransferase
VTVSDRAARHVYEDESGPAVGFYLEARIAGELDLRRRMVPDERSSIEGAVKELCDSEGCCLVLTTGGTGPAERDVTPEATEAVCERLLPGFGEAMRRASIDKVPSALLSRQVAGVRGSTLVINLPGSQRAIADCLDAVLAAVPHCVRLLGGPVLELVGREDRAVPSH